MAKRETAEGLDPEVVGRMLPFLRALRGYTRLKADGWDQIPAGPVILAANHTGWLGLDYAMAAVVLHDELGRTPRGLAHSAWFVAPPTAEFAAKVGLHKVSKEAMAEILRQGHLAMVFPEGEHGAFRPGSNYTLLEFARGFVRVALELGVPIVPVAILGGEESNPVERTINSYEQFLRMPIPIPRNLLPKPVKWRIRFLPPIRPTGDPGNKELVHGVAQNVRQLIQDELRQLEKERGHPYI